MSGAIVAADRMLKTADVELSSIQNTKGNGWVTLQVSGELSAIIVAVQAVKDYLPDVYVTSAVIGRPATGLNSLGKTDLLQPNSKKQQSKNIAEKKEVTEPSLIKEKLIKKSENSDEPNVQVERSLEDKDEINDKQDINSNDDEVTCNMCGDPKCPRKLGEPHKKCIHYNELKKK
ncbi:BMC domain-containing protein [Limosilactobacillus agrestis]|nr:BMC domain-containing protein [Limosilactobacillus agrestis]